MLLINAHQREILYKIVDANEMNPLKKNRKFVIFYFKEDLKYRIF